MRYRTKTKLTRNQKSNQTFDPSSRSHQASTSHRTRMPRINQNLNHTATSPFAKDYGKINLSSIKRQPVPKMRPMSFSPPTQLFSDPRLISKRSDLSCSHRKNNGKLVRL